MKQDLAGSSSPIHVAAAARSEAVAAAADPAASSQQQHQGSSSKSNSSMGNQGKQKEEGCILISPAATQTSDISIPQSATRRRREQPYRTLSADPSPAFSVNSRDGHTYDLRHHPPSAMVSVPTVYQAAAQIFCKLRKRKSICRLCLKKIKYLLCILCVKLQFKTIQPF